jgi:hypothetical protein
MSVLDRVRHRWTGSVTFRKRRFLASRNRWSWEWRRKDDMEIGILQPFVRPFGLSFDTKGNAFVADFDGHRIIRFSPEWEFSGWLGRAEKHNQRTEGWSEAEGLAVENAEAGGFSRPHNIAFDRDGNFLVTELSNGRLQKFSEDGRHLGYIGTGANGGPPLKGPATAYYCDDGYLYVTDFSKNCFHRYTHDGRFVDWMAEAGSGFSTTGAPPQERQPEQFNKPHVARTDDEGNILVGDTGKHCVLRFRPNGSFAGWIGAREGGGITKGWDMDGRARISREPGGFTNPSSLRFDADGNMIIAESLNNRIQKFTQDGYFLGWFGGKEKGGITSGWEMEGYSRKGNEPGVFNHPFDAVVRDGTLYVADTENGRLQAIRGL